MRTEVLITLGVRVVKTLVFTHVVRRGMRVAIQKKPRRHISDGYEEAKTVYSLFIDNREVTIAYIR